MGGIPGQSAHGEHDGKASFFRSEGAMALETISIQLQVPLGACTCTCTFYNKLEAGFGAAWTAPYAKTHPPGQADLVPRLIWGGGSTHTAELRCAGASARPRAAACFKLKARNAWSKVDSEPRGLCVYPARILLAAVTPQSPMCFRKS